MEKQMSLLSRDAVQKFHQHGYIAPLSGLSEEGTRILRAVVIEHLEGPTGAERAELTDDVQVRNRTDATQPEYEYVDVSPEPHLRELPFLFNLSKIDHRIEQVAHDQRFVSYAKSLLGVEEVLLMEDNVVIKLPGAKAIPWHQDYSYWPLGEPRALTIWIALDDIGPTNGAMIIARGTQKEGERLPVRFMDGSSFMAGERPGVQPVPSDPQALGHVVDTYDLTAGQCGVHDALVWHGSTPNESKSIRCALVLRYIAMGTIWLGSARMPYEDVGCPTGQALTAAHFPLAGLR
jgi:hypothetical protein